MRAFLGLVFVGVTSCTTTAPLQLLPSTIPVEPGSFTTGSEVVEGRACESSFLFIFRWGDSSVAAAKADALASANVNGLVDVSVDVESSFYVISGESCTVVRGRRILRKHGAPAQHQSPNDQDNESSALDVEPRPKTEPPAAPRDDPQEQATDSGGDASGSGLTEDVIGRAIGRVSARIAGCSDEDPSAKGHVIVSVRVQPAGDVRSVVVKATPGKALGECVVRILSRAKFDATQTGGRFNYTFDFPP